MHDGRIAGGDIENLEIASDVVAVRNEVALGRSRDAHIAEPASLHDAVVVGTHEQADVHGVRE